MMERALETIARNARVQARLVDDLFDLGRIISGKLRVGLRPLDPRGFIVAAVETVRSAAEAKGVAFGCKPSGAAQCWRVKVPRPGSPQASPPYG
jgi:signal transduction histidine kinase